MVDSERLKVAISEFQDIVATSWAKCENGGSGGIESEGDLRYTARKAAQKQGLANADGAVDEIIMQQILSAPIH